jgi:acid phosphatase (class A)
MLRRSGRAAVATVFLLAFATSAGLAKTDAAYHYLYSSEIDLVDLLAPPPDSGSPTAQKDEEKVACAVAERTPVQLGNALDESKRSVLFFAPSLGTRFAPERLPLFMMFFARVESDVEKLVDAAKLHWQRPRPPYAREKNGSYPSGHAAFAASTAIILSEMVPEKRNAIFTQARLFAENRIILAVHYPSDISAGWITGTLAVAAMMRDKRYQRDFAIAKAELRGQLAEVSAVRRTSLRNTLHPGQFVPRSFRTARHYARQH